MPVRPISVPEAIKLLQIHRYRVHQVGKRLRTLDEMRGSIIRKLEAIAGARRHEERLAGRDPDGAA